MNESTIILIVVASLAVSFLLPRVLMPWLTGQAKHRRVLASGVSARATVTSLDQTGTTINDQPKCRIGLLVEPKDGAPFAATTTQLVLLTQIPQFQPGAVVTVRYVPGDPSQIAIEAFGHTSIDQAEAERMIAASARLMAELDQPGASLPAPAIVTAFNPTGVKVNGPNPLAVLELKVLPEGGAPFDATVAGVFGAQALAKYQPGKTVRVRFDPADPSRVSFDGAKTSVALVDPPSK